MERSRDFLVDSPLLWEFTEERRITACVIPQVRRDIQGEIWVEIQRELLRSATAPANSSFDEIIDFAI